nr:nucleotide transporter 3 [Ecytonucleospora hepatopenaei]
MGFYKNCNEKINEKDCKSLTKDKYREMVEKHTSTKLGLVFPVISIEWKRVLLFSLIKFVAAVQFNTARVFKDRVVYILDNIGLIYFLNLLVFICNFFILKFYTWLVKKYGVNKATEKFLCYMALFFCFYNVLFYFSNFISSGAFVKEMFNGNLKIIRNLNFIEIIALLVFNAVYVLFYLSTDIITHAIISVILMAYFLQNMTSFQIKRYFRIIGAFNGISYLFSSFLTSFYANLEINWFTKKSEKWLFMFFYFVNAFFSIVLVIVIKITGKQMKNYLYQGEQEELGITKNKPKSTLNFIEMLKLICFNDLLYSISVFSLLYNLFSSLFGTVDKFTYKAYITYILQHPNQNPFQFGEATFSRLQAHFKKFEFYAQSIMLILIMLSPVLTKLWQIFGFFAFGAIMLILYAFAAVTQCLVTIYNYPFTHNGKSSLFGLKFGNFSPNFYLEAFLACINNFLIKLSKSGFFDIAKEVYFARIVPSDRVVFKSICDGVIPRLCKVIVSFYGIFVTQVLGIVDVRKIYIITFTAMLLIIILAFKPLIFITRHLKRAEKNDEYLICTKNKKEF